MIGFCKRDIVSVVTEALDETQRLKYPISYTRGVTIRNMILKGSAFVREIAFGTLSPEQNNL